MAKEAAVTAVERIFRQLFVASRPPSAAHADLAAHAEHAASAMVAAAPSKPAAGSVADVRLRWGRAGRLCGCQRSGLGGGLAERK